jgi:predicted nuclease with TOPRIM domain
MLAKVQDFDNACLKSLAVLEGAAAAANLMTTHKEADDEVKAFKDRYTKVKVVSDEWVKKSDTLVKEWKLLDNTVNELNSWIATDRGAQSEKGFSLEKMESTLGELKNIFKEKERLVENL